jgi:hypothetical protein
MKPSLQLLQLRMPPIRMHPRLSMAITITKMTKK